MRYGSSRGGGKVRRVTMAMGRVRVRFGDSVDIGAISAPLPRLVAILLQFRAGQTVR